MPETAGARPGDRLIRAGLVVTAVGMLLALIAMLPLVSDVELPGTFWWLSMLVGVGMAMILVGLARNGRRRARAQTAARTASD
jgi:peptidoglycan/LPS O-acetylase OafA/YrhL